MTNLCIQKIYLVTFFSCNVLNITLNRATRALTTLQIIKWLAINPFNYITITALFICSLCISTNRWCGWNTVQVDNTTVSPLQYEINMAKIAVTILLVACVWAMMFVQSTHGIPLDVVIPENAINSDQDIIIIIDSSDSSDIWWSDSWSSSWPDSWSDSWSSSSSSSDEWY